MEVLLGVETVAVDPWADRVPGGVGVGVVLGVDPFAAFCMDAMAAETSFVVRPRLCAGCDGVAERILLDTKFQVVHIIALKSLLTYLDASALESYFEG